MNQLIKEALYQHIPVYKAGMLLPDLITILYVRLSNEDRDKAKRGDDSNSIVNQKILLTELAKNKCLPNPIFFVDDDFTGSNFDRPDFAVALELVKAGRVETFAVKDMARFGRDHIYVGLYTEHLFTEMGVRFISHKENVDTAVKPIDEEDMIPFTNIINEYHCKNTSKGVKMVLHAKGNRGEPLCTKPPFGYKKDPDNPKKRWIIDEPAAKVVQRIFQYCMDGLGPTRIANRLRNEQVDIPTLYAIKAGHQKTDKREHALDPYGWQTSTVVKILERREYLGHLINFKTYSKSYKQRKRLKNDPSKHVVVENAHEAIISEEVFERVQQLRSNKRRPRHSGRENVLAGLVFCADCKSKMNLSSGASMKPEQDYFCCSGFNTKKKQCNSSHFIRRVVLEQAVLAYVQKVTAIATEHEKVLMDMLEYQNSVKLTNEVAADKKSLQQSEKRVKELDILIQQLFEKNALGVISDERFATLSEGYEVEQKGLKATVKALSEQVTQQLEASAGIGKFLVQIRKYTRITELTPTLLNELIERVEINARSQRYSKGSQQIDFYFNYVGKLDLIPDFISEKQRKMPTQKQPKALEAKQLEKIPIISAINS